MAWMSIPDEVDAPYHENQGGLYRTQVETLAAGSRRHGVVLGVGSECAVTWNSGRIFDVAAGMTLNETVPNNVSAGQVTLDVNDLNPRFDWIVVSSAGTKTFRKGTAAVDPTPPSLTAGDVALALVYVDAATLAANRIYDMRVAVNMRPVPMTTTERDNLTELPGFFIQNETTGGVDINIPSVGAPTSARWMGLKAYNYLGFFSGTMITGSSVSGDRLYLRGSDSDNGIITMRLADVSAGSGNDFILGALTIETTYTGVPAVAQGRSLFNLGANAGATDVYMYPATDGGRCGWQQFLGPWIFGTGSNTSYADGSDVQLSHRMLFISTHGWTDSVGSHSSSPQQHISFYSVSYEYTLKTTTTAAISSAGAAGDSVTVAVTTPGNLTVNNPYLMVDAGITAGEVGLTPANHPEIMLCTAINGSDVTFQRGWLGTRTYTHASGSQIFLVTNRGEDRKFFQVPHGIDTDGYEAGYLRMAMTADVEMTNNKVLAFNNAINSAAEKAFGERAAAAGFRANSANDNVIETLPGGLSLPMPTTGTALRISGGAGSHACTLDGTLWYNTTLDALELRGGFAPAAIDQPAWITSDADGPYGIELFPTSQTYASVAGDGSAVGARGFYMDSTISIGFTTQGNNKYTFMDIRPTITHTTAAAALQEFAGFILRPTIQNSGNVQFGLYFGWVDQPNIFVNSNNSLTMGQLYSVYSQPTVGQSGGGVGTMNITNLRQFAAIGPTVNTGGVVATRVGVYITDASGAGTVTNNIGIDIAAMTKGATLNYGIRNASALVQSGITAFTHSAQDMTLAETISATATVVETSTASPNTLTGTPTIADGIANQVLIIVNVGSAAITLQDQGTLANSNLRLNAATIALGTRDSIALYFSPTIGDWVQIVPVSNNL